MHEIAQHSYILVPNRVERPCERGDRNPAKAGVFIGNGELPSWRLDAAASSANAVTAIYFREGSWDNVDVNLNLEDELVATSLKDW